MVKYEKEHQPRIEQHAKTWERSKFNSEYSMLQENLCLCFVRNSKVAVLHVCANMYGDANVHCAHIDTHVAFQRKT